MGDGWGRGEDRGNNGKGRLGTHQQPLEFSIHIISHSPSSPHTLPSSSPTHRSATLPLPPDIPLPPLKLIAKTVVIAVTVLVVVGLTRSVGAIGVVDPLSLSLSLTLDSILIRGKGWLGGVRLMRMRVRSGLGAGMGGLWAGGKMRLWTGEGVVGGHVGEEGTVSKKGE